MTAAAGQLPACKEGDSKSHILTRKMWLGVYDLCVWSELGATLALYCVYSWCSNWKNMQTVFYTLENILFFLIVELCYDTPYPIST